ncbi:MAG: tetratricopeptide repeat protein [Paludibacteraceae bacterium]|nr:tetratricopeptide repeat protein [Paludibacteraceae bacterium]
MKRFIIIVMKEATVFCAILLSISQSALGQGFDLRSLSKEALSRGADGAAVYFLYADYLRNSGDFPDLEITAYYLTEKGEFSKADSLLKRIESEKVIEQLNDSLRRYYYLARANVCFENNDYINCLRSLDEVTDEYVPPRLMAECYQELGLYEKAIAKYASMFDDYNEGYVNCLIAECYRAEGLFEKAIEHYLQAMNNRPAWAMPYYGAGWSYELSGDDSLALEYYNKGLSVDQSYAYLFLMRGELLLKLGREEQAKDDFNTVLRLDRTISDGSCRQYALMLLGREDDALIWMNRIIEHQPDNPGHYYDKACLCCRMGLLIEAVDALKIAFSKGYRRFAHIIADDDVDPIKEIPEFKELFSYYYSHHLKELETINDILQ